MQQCRNSLKRERTNNSLRDIVLYYFSDVLLRQLRELSTAEAPMLLEIFVSSLPTHILERLPPDEVANSRLRRTSGIEFRRTCAEQPDTILEEFDRQYSKALEACFSCDLKEREGVNNKQIELMTKELQINFHFSVKPDAQIKAELVCRTREMFWLTKGNKE